jgi:putative component of membrane protein insertase Oxa1/YidC/SpoIIIJ protein YidD
MRCKHKLISVVMRLSSPLTFIVYLFVLVLMKCAPDATNFRNSRAQRLSQPGFRPQVERHNEVWIVTFIVCLYRRSEFRTFLNRHGPRCCFIPSCSEYSVLAVGKYGLWRGLLLIGDRFRRCTPLYQGAYLDFP